MEVVEFGPCQGLVLICGACKLRIMGRVASSRL